MINLINIKKLMPKKVIIRSTKNFVDTIASLFLIELNFVLWYYIFSINFHIEIYWSILNRYIIKYAYFYKKNILNFFSLYYSIIILIDFSTTTSQDKKIKKDEVININNMAAVKFYF